MKTTDGGATWTATTTDPFGTAQVVNGLVCFPISATATRLVAGLGTTVGGAPAKVNYSDDGGVTWATAVSVGSTNAQFLPSPHSMFAYDAGNMWVGTSGGYIYKSTDGAKTWTTQNAGTVTTGNINSIHFVSDRVGWASAAADVIARTLDGGSTWSQVAVTGASASITKVFGLDSQRAWAATANGRLYKTLDAGVTWTQSRFSGDNAGSVTDIKFINSLVGYITHNSATPSRHNSPHNRRRLFMGGRDHPDQWRADRPGLVWCQCGMGNRGGQRCHRYADQSAELIQRTINSLPTGGAWGCPCKFHPLTYIARGKYGKRQTTEGELYDSRRLHAAN